MTPHHVATRYFAEALYVILDDSFWLFDGESSEEEVEQFMPILAIQFFARSDVEALTQKIRMSTPIKSKAAQKRKHMPKILHLYIVTVL